MVVLFLGRLNGEVHCELIYKLIQLHPAPVYPDMVVSGVPNPNGQQHACNIASMALDLVSACRAFVIPHRRDTQLQIRVGIHTGGCQWSGCIQVGVSGRDT